MRSYDRFRAALADRELPAAFVDLDAFDRNVAQVRGLLAGTAVRLRVGTKSLRCVALLERLRDALGDRGGGVMAFTAAEAEALVGRGFRDVVVAYPSARPADARRLARLARAGAFVAAMVDDARQLPPLAAAAVGEGTTVPVVLDVDMAWRPPGLPTAVALGVRRSPLFEPAAVVALARRVAETSGLRFVGVMGYEAQIAGLPDRDGRGRREPAHAFVKALSRGQVRARRGAVRAALEAAGLAPALVNGGGTGSARWTAGDPAVTEVTVGSGFLGGTLFDGLDDFAPEPSLFFALPVARVPAPGLVTCLGGGYVASGSPGWEKLPRPCLPPGLSLLPWEGAGEVQTPLRVPPEVSLAPGDPVVFRHAKAGELAERFAAYHLLRGERIEATVATYRGEGWCFL
jgi:D-serine deaminase-like pyridoxal phosphate-dependent protein